MKLFLHLFQKVTKKVSKVYLLKECKQIFQVRLKTENQKKTNLTKREKFICNQIKSKLREKGLFFTGIDVIDGYLTEINVTSPTCIREIDTLNKVNISYIYWEEALQLRNH